MSTIPAEYISAWNDLVTKSHEDQAIWFLNAFWNGGVKEKAEDIWAFHEKFSQIDPNGGNGYDHDEFWSHKFLEDLGETISVVDLRKKLGEIDIDKNKRMCLSEYLLFKYGRSVVDLVTAPQGDPEELAKAQALVDQAAAAVDEVLSRLEAQRLATEKARQDEALAAQREAEAAQREAELVQAKKELEAALAELKAQEDAYNKKTQELKAKSEAGGVSGLRAKNELAQHLEEDPLPLRRAKLTQEAAVKKADKAAKIAAEATAAAASATAAAAASREAAEESERQLERALQEAEEKRKEALAYLDKVKASGAGAGRVWWMKRGMYEKQKYLPTAKQTMPYPKPE